jgi:formylglycine-generating enzyme
LAAALLSLPGDVFQMGCDRDEGEPFDGEGPVRSRRLSAFRISATAVSNEEFATFVAATDYVSYAEAFDVLRFEA